MSRIDELYRRYFQRIVRALRGHPDAEDIAQETLIARWKRPDDPDDEVAYLVKSARNNAKKRVMRAAAPRRGGGHIEPLADDHDAPDDSASIEAELIEREEVARFRADFNTVMNELSPDTQQALVLRGRGLGSKEIAARLGLSDQAVRTRLSRATALLRERLTPPPDVPWIDLLGDDDDHQR